MENQIKSISERLKYLAKDNNTYISYTDTKIKSENLKYNISLLISKIIIELNFVERSKSNFLDCIIHYNKEHKTDLKFDDFEKISWIRNINNEIVLPEVVRSFIWKIGYNEENNKPTNIPEDKIDIAKCLQYYYKNYFENSRLTISKVKLENIINNFNNEEINIEFLLEREIIENTNDKDLFIYRNHEYERHLRNEIAATLWLLIGGEEATEDNFSFYFKLIQGTQIWIDNIQEYLSKKNCDKILDLAILFINNEKDLDHSDNEFTKIWLDSPSYSHIKIEYEIPILKFNYNSSLDFIEDIEKHKWQYKYAFDYQKTRSFTLSLLRLIVSLDDNKINPYEEVIKLLKNINKPHIVWTLYKDIIPKYPEIIPYLIKEKELIPLALKKMDNLSISDNLIDKNLHRDKIQENNNKVFDEFYIELLDMILRNLVKDTSSLVDNANVIGGILLDNASKVFDNPNNYKLEIDHNYYRDRYDKIIKKISSLKISNNNFISNSTINPRYILSLIPELVKYILEKNKETKIYKNDFLKLSSGNLDLSIEILRFSNINILEDEVSEKLKKDIENCSIELTKNIQNHLVEFYECNEISIKTYDTVGYMKKKPIRGVNEFGIEIIDWGYLFLQLNKLELFNKTCERIINSFKIDSSTTIYEYQNKEQFEKIKLFLKTLMLSYYAIHFRKNFYESEELKPNELLNELETKIKELAIQYSVDDVANNRLNIFIERYELYGYNKYYQRLSTLLYDSINLFNNDGKEEFINSFFKDNVDIGSMLSALNSINDKKSQDVIANRIKKVDIKDFIKKSYSLSNLENAVIEAINSENHWELAKPILLKIKEHLDLIKRNTYEAKNFLFEIELLLALKENNINELKEIEVPINEHSYPKVNPKGVNEKMFFTALHYLFNDKEFDETIKILKILLSKDEKNIKYAFYLYKSKTLKAINQNG